jgi:hypothetical protein
MEQPTRFIGMDVHKDTIVVAVTAAGDVGKAVLYGTFPNTAATVEKLVSLTYSTNLPVSRQKCVGHSCPTHWFQHEFRTEMPGVEVFGT